MSKRLTKNCGWWFSKNQTTSKSAKKLMMVQRCTFLLFVVTILSTLFYTYYLTSPLSSYLTRKRTYLEPAIHCSSNGTMQLKNAQIEHHHHWFNSKLRTDSRILIFVETTYSKLGREIAELLVHVRMKYRIDIAGKSLPVLTNADKGKFGVIIFENLNRYLCMDKWNRELLDKYCREYGVGIIGFFPPSLKTEQKITSPPQQYQLRGFPLYYRTQLKLKDATLNAASPVLRTTKAGETVHDPLPGDDWIGFETNDITYEVVEWAVEIGGNSTNGGGSNNTFDGTVVTVIRDRGEYDGIQRIIFGSGLNFWLHRLLFLDSLSYLSHGQLSFSLERLLLIDIDDIFVGERGTRMQTDDVKALLRTQERIQQMVPGFRFNLGFSGKYFHHGTPEENLGDDMILENADKFTWFSHMWNHQQPHLYTNQTILEADMMLNKNFAKEHGIPTDCGYSIAPHHSGVYPVHELLYSAWKNIWNIRVTATEEYPHLRPARLRRGFIHRGIMVLPRQTCGLFTHTIFIERYPGGRVKLDESIQGGELFQTFIYNPVNVFMSHMSNYGNDRLALYTFESVIRFLHCWTNLKIISAPPVQLAQKYFKLFPEEIDPIWGNPCEDARHLKIWTRKSCSQLPSFLIIGPQKTGTTALYSFLSIHPNISSNLPNPVTFEEIQFFNGHNYFKGLDWYMNFFPVMNDSSVRYIFEKSATYFDGETVPRRAHALLPSAKIVIILISPSKRAYSWYQHMKSHNDPVALNYTFYDVITSNETAPKAIKDIRNRCLNPGKYVQHLERWLQYYAPQQLHIIDGDELRSDPVHVMDQLQKFLKLATIFDYTDHLRYNHKKGFFCQVLNGGDNVKCLGRSKGRRYNPMDEKSRKFLQKYYLSHNTALVKLLKKLGYRTFPQWLKDDISDASS